MPLLNLVALQTLPNMASSTPFQTYAKCLKLRMVSRRIPILTYWVYELASLVLDHVYFIVAYEVLTTNSIEVRTNIL